MRLPLALASLLLLSVAVPAQTPAQTADPPALPTVAARIAGMRHTDGLLPLDWDAKTGRIFLEVALPEAEGTRSADLLWVHSLPFGVGSNDIGLDRGQLGGVGEVGGSRIVHFERTGPKVLLVQPNLSFRTASPDPAEQLAVAQSFPSSVLAGFKVEAETSGSRPVVLIDATDLVLRDVHGVAEALAAAKQGSYKLDPARSAVALDGTKAFPRNTELEGMLTFATEGAAPGQFVGDVTPDPHAITVHEHQSFLQLPGPGFTPRRFSPRSGSFAIQWREMNAPLGEPLDQIFVPRFRLQKRDPRCTRACAPAEPIRYFVDRGAPEPIRSALLEGARWWDAAFQAAGWAPNTFRVELLPADADPMDIRYNIIQWVHRYTRGWSYGNAISDPRTGEIIKGNVTLGSLRGRQDYLIAEALLSPYTDGRAPSDASRDPALGMVLARLRQLAAHETGHTLGLSHSFASSGVPHPPDQTVSVMDYPHPYITLEANGVPDLSHAYSAGIGTWDKVTIDYFYREFDHAGTPLEDPAALDQILAEAERSGHVYITDQDARPLGGAHPTAHLWDNGADAADELRRISAVRAAALARFGENAIRNGTPTAQLEDTLVPLFLLHRYQTEAATKLIGGLDYRYTVRGDGQPSPRIVAGAEQNKAIAAVLSTLAPAFLTLPEPLLKLLPPRPPGLDRTRESFASETGLTFDPVAAAESAADLTLAGLLDPERASRLIQFHMREGASPSLRSVLEALSKTVAERPDGGHSLASEVGRAVETRAYERMFSLAADAKASSQARAIVRSHLVGTLATLKGAPVLEDTAEAIHRAALIARLEQFEREPEKLTPAPPVETPPGMPIGDEEEM